MGTVGLAFGYAWVNNFDFGSLSVPGFLENSWRRYILYFILAGTYAGFESYRRAGKKNDPPAVS
jgi:hypothetical protein